MTDLALWCQSRMAEGGIVPPHSVLAPGTALELLRSRALPSAQVNRIVAVATMTHYRNPPATGRRCDEARFGRLFDPSCRWQFEIPPVWANSRLTVDAAASARNGQSQAARCFEWSGPYGEEFATDKSASANYQAELLTAIVSGTSRRNGLGAIASKRTIATSRSDDNRDESKKQEQRPHEIH
jgi:hypothetical protein